MYSSTGGRPHDCGVSRMRTKTTIGDGRGDQRVEVELRPPVVEERDAEQGEVGDQRAADVVGDVPDRDDAAALARAEPVHHRLAAGRPAHALHPAVERLQRDQDAERAVERLEETRRST